jgi:nucleoside phosphorylase
MTVLVCAATRSELGACARGIRASGAPAAAFETLRIGVGPIHAAKSLGQRLANGERPNLVVSSGFVGALSAGVDVGTWVTATRVAEWRNGTIVDVAEVALCRGPEPALRCSVVSSGQLLQGGNSPRRADDSLLAADMESAALAREAAGRNIAFMVLRLVSDTPEHPLPGFLLPLTTAMAATSARSKFAHAALGVRGALVDPRGVARIVREGGAWIRELARGWECFAPLVLH